MMIAAMSGSKLHLAGSGPVIICVSRQASLLWGQLLATFPQGTRMALQRLVEG